MLTERARNQSKDERIAPLKVLRTGEGAGLSPGKLLVHEVYTSLQGEGTRAGVLCTFVRLAACHLRCAYCDTEHAFETGTVRSVEEVAAEVSDLGVKLVQLTGGEPLLQPGAFALMGALLDAGHDVALETSGAVSTAKVDARAVVVLDVKTPGSGESERNVLSNLERLRGHDEVKFVITSEADYRFALDTVKAHGLDARCTVLFSPAAPAMDPTTLAEWMVRDRAPARFQLQMHKVLWGEKTGV